jgi:hypothetical protein
LISVADTCPSLAHNKQTAWAPKASYLLSKV